MKPNLKTALVIAAIAALIAWIVIMVDGCKAPRFQPPPPPPNIAKSLEPPNPCPECPPDTNFTLPTWPPLNTNAIWLEVLDHNLVIPDTNFSVDYWIVTRANNLTNGHHYLWWRSSDLLEWIPLSSFLASTNWAIRTNGIAAPAQHFFRIEQTD